MPSTLYNAVGKKKQQQQQQTAKPYFSLYFFLINKLKSKFPVYNFTKVLLTSSTPNQT